MDNINEEFDKIKEYMDKIIEKAFQDEDIDQRHKPKIYGISMKFGPNDKPQIREFGNNIQKHLPCGRKIWDENKSFTDIIEGEKTIAITVEIPGVEKEEINMNTTDKALTIDINTAQRKFHTVIEYPCEVNPDTIKATYKNGVLDITIDRNEEIKRVGKRVEIE